MQTSYGILQYFCNLLIVVIVPPGSSDDIHFKLPGDDVGDVLAMRSRPSEAKGKANINVEPPFKSETDERPISWIQGELAVGPSQISGIKKTAPPCLPN